jgi:hypothetical protein
MTSYQDQLEEKYRVRYFLVRLLENSENNCDGTLLDVFRASATHVKIE